MISALQRLWPGAALAAGESRRPVTRKQIRRLYDAPESFTDLLPWTEYLPEHQAVALADGRSVGAFFELQPAATDGQSPEY
ncbi:MAG: TraC family protein, partial [Gammaproteobacteria bacterium]